MKIAKLKPQISPEQQTLNKNWKKYLGSIVLVVDNQIFATKRAKNVHKMIIEIEKKYHKKPLIAYMPKADLLIV